MDRPRPARRARAHRARSAMGRRTRGDRGTQNRPVAPHRRAAPCRRHATQTDTQRTQGTHRGRTQTLSGRPRIQRLVPTMHPAMRAATQSTPHVGHHRTYGGRGCRHRQPSPMSSGTTSNLGALSVDYRSPDGTAPDIVLVSNGPYAQAYEGYGADYQLMRWGSAQPDGFQIRVARGGQWAGKVPVFFSWLAVWLHPGVKS